jgi:hypothetical protein
VNLALFAKLRFGQSQFLSYLEVMTSHIHHQSVALSSMFIAWLLIGTLALCSRAWDELQ